MKGEISACYEKVARIRQNDEVGNGEAFILVLQPKTKSIYN